MKGSKTNKKAAQTRTDQPTFNVQAYTLHKSTPKMVETGVGPRSHSTKND